MQLLISDANILIDLEEGRLLRQLFKLPYEFKVPDILYYEELEQQHGYLIDLGLGLGALDERGMQRAFQFTRRYNGPSRNDCFALALASREGCPLLTGDKALRKAAEQEAIPVNGTLWVVEQMVVHRVITRGQAKAGYQQMKASDRRLPWNLAFNRLADL